MGLLPANGQVESGSVTFNGKELLSLSRREMREIRGRDIGMIFQEPKRSLDPCFSVGAQIADVVRAHACRHRAGRRGRRR